MGCRAKNHAPDVGYLPTTAASCLHSWTLSTIVINTSRLALPSFSVPPSPMCTHACHISFPHSSLPQAVLIPTRLQGNGVFWVYTWWDVTLELQVATTKESTEYMTLSHRSTDNKSHFLNNSSWSSHFIPLRALNTCLRCLPQAPWSAPQLCRGRKHVLMISPMY